MMEIWYLLYDGTSADGLGQGKYCGRTLDMFTAIEHFEKVKNDPFNTGKVVKITDSEMKTIWEIADFRLEEIK